MIVGLGNPSGKYAHTRHNLGFDAIDMLAQRLGVTVAKNEKRALTGAAYYDSTKLLLVKPQTFMNLSGESVRPLADYYGVGLSDILILVDDVNLDTGVLRLRRGGSDGGHNGLKSIALHLGTQDYARLRIGAGKPGERDLVDFVLGGYCAEERKLVDESLLTAGEAALCFVTEGIEAAMNKYNGMKRSVTVDKEV